MQKTASGVKNFTDLYLLEIPVNRVIHDESYVLGDGQNDADVSLSQDELSESYVST